MITLNPRNVNQALSLGLKLMCDPDAPTYGTESRNGHVITCGVPVATVTAKPLERVLFSPLRNANPFFHLMEALWMLAGRNDLAWLGQYNKRMLEYSDDGGKTQPGAYGYRWRKNFGYDQLDEIVEALARDPSSRRAVLTMWDAWGIHQTSDREFVMNGDLLSAGSSKDVPCNTHVYFRIIGDALHMTVCCRSNDLWWGAHGANAVNFSVLLEYMAARLNVRVGTMTQISNDYHIYTDIVKDLGARAHDAMVSDRYTRGVTQGLLNATPMFHYNTMDLFEEELPRFMDFFDPVLNPIKTPWKRGGARERPTTALNHSFLADVAFPIARAWDSRKVYDYETAIDRCYKIGDMNCDWRAASAEWMHRAAELSTPGGTER